MNHFVAAFFDELRKISLDISTDHKKLIIEKQFQDLMKGLAASQPQEPRPGRVGQVIHHTTKHPEAKRGRSVRGGVLR